MARHFEHSRELSLYGAVSFCKAFRLCWERGDQVLWDALEVTCFGNFEFAFKHKITYNSPSLLNVLFHRYRRSERGLVLTLMRMVVQDVSTCRGKDITTELCGREFSSSTVSRPV